MALSVVQRPRKLRDGDRIRVVAPSLSRGIIDPAHHDLANSRLRALGLDVTFGAHVDEMDAFDSSPVSSRVADLHDAFPDPTVAGIITVIGGFNSNQLLPHLDWELIAGNPKVFCGYSDITALQHTLLAHTGLLTYSGPHWSSFAMRDHFERATRRGCGCARMRSGVHPRRAGHTTRVRLCPDAVGGAPAPGGGVGRVRLCPDAVGGAPAPGGGVGRVRLCSDAVGGAPAPRLMRRETSVTRSRVLHIRWQSLGQSREEMRWNAVESAR